MVPFNGSDGTYTDTTVNGYNVHQSTSGFMYFHRPGGISFTAGTMLYAEVDYVDQGGPGRIGMQYNSQYSSFQDCNFFFLGSLENTGLLKTAVYRLDYSQLQFTENGGTDLRLTRGGNLQFNVVEVRVSDVSDALYAQQTAYLTTVGPPAYLNETPVDNTTIMGKVVAGYQGWFRTPNDDGDTGWEHYIPNWGNPMVPSNIAIDMWPDMTEFTPAEQHAATGFTNPDSSQTYVFSSDSWRTVLRHFQWMEAWGLDGVALQRNADDLVNPDAEILRNTMYVRQASALTGRVYYIEYALKITTTMNDLAPLIRDWHYMVDTLQVTQDPGYLHQGGLPVVGIFGFYPVSQIDNTVTANALMDIFQTPGPYQAWVAGAGEWYWRTDPAVTAPWLSVLYRFASYQPWNTGNGASATQGPSTNYWAADKAQLAAQATPVLYQPQIYPGGSADNRSHTTPGATLNGRLQGGSIWGQFAQARSINAPWVFVGMFDEMDEGTEIFKITNAPPTQTYTQAYEGLPSDCYLCFTEQGAKMLRGQIPYTTVVPPCPGMSQPSIPDCLSPLSGTSLGGPNVTLSWSQAFPAQAATASVVSYIVDVDGVTTPASSLSTLRPLSLGLHVWRVEAVNSSGNTSGWSLKEPFTVVAASPTVLPVDSSSEVLKLAPAPNPQSGPYFSFVFDLSGQPAQVEAKIYSTGFEVVAQASFKQGLAPGWNHVLWYVPKLANGIYYVRFKTDKGAGASSKLAVLR
jgi:hypothetical protein